MHFGLLSLIFWTLPSPRHSYSTIPTYTQYVMERGSPGLTNNIPASSPSVSFPLPSPSCHYEQGNGLAIFCTGIDIEELAPNIPNDTVRLEITESPFPIFKKPLLFHLHNLRYLKLNHNAHKYITSKAFQGLYNLEELDLSFNDIIVLSKAFIHTPNLKALNLSSNQIVTLRTIATSLSHLENFQNLSLDHNVRIRRILRDELLPFNNTRLTKLQLLNTTIRVIEEGTFRPLRHLKMLDLSVNYLDEIGFRNVTADLKHNEVLFIRDVQFQNGLPYDALLLLGNTSVMHLDISYNYFRSLDQFPNIRTLTELDVMFCSVKIIATNSFAGLPNLERLSLSGNQLSGLPKNLFALPKLKYLSLANQKFSDDENKIMSLPDYIFKNATNLSYLDVRNSRVDKIIRRYTFYGLQKLKILLLSFCAITHIEDHAYETLVNLEALDLRNNYLNHLTNHTFAGLRSLEKIDLSDNKIKFVQGIYPFRDIPSLSVMYLKNNEIVEIPNGMFFRNLLLGELILSQNKVMAWNFTILAPKSKISLLLLSKNKITHITPSMMIDFLRVSDVLDVSGNPFNCTACGMKDFQRFMNETKASLFNLDETNVTGTYTCSSPKNFQGMPVQSVDIPVWHCFPHEINIAVFVMTILLSAIIPALLVSVFCYMSRWYVKYWMFHIKAALKEGTQSKDAQQRHIYDAFVAYNASDTPWVINTLIPALEEQEPRFKLCIHERDFEVGRLITDNILDAIEVSRKVILLLSESFLASEWCMFELHMAQHKLFDETRDVLVLVKLTDIDKKFYTRNLRYLEKTRPCLSWTDNPTGEKLFWDKMKRILGKPSTELHSRRKATVLKNNSSDDMRDCL